MPNTCEHRTLIDNDICQIKYCASCGKVHLSLGAMTLNLTSKQFEQLASSLEQAARGKRDIDDPKHRRVFRSAEVVH